MTIREWLDGFSAATGETVTHLCLGDRWDLDWPEYPVNVARPINEFAAMLDVDFYNGPDLCGWSPSWVVFADTYDSFEELRWVPRAPTDHAPVRPGGGG